MRLVGTIMAFVIFFSLFLVPKSYTVMGRKQDTLITGDPSESRAGISTYITGLSGPQPVLGWKSLHALTNGKMNYESFGEVIEKYLLPLNARLVMLDVGWGEHANTSNTNIRHLEWVDEWLSACDKYGVANIFFIKQFGHISAAPSWETDVIIAYPDARTYNKKGYPVDYFSIDTPAILEQFKEDLKQLWEYYGEHPSWIGIGEGSSGDFQLYARKDAQIRDFGFANYTLANFVNSIYFKRDINSTGFHKDGTECKLWKMFKGERPTIVLSSGEYSQWIWESDVYNGTRTSGHCVAAKFKVPEDMNGFQIRWYGNKEGTPPNLTLELYDDLNDMPYPLGTPIETMTQASAEISRVAEWQPAVAFTSSLIKDKFYWIVFQMTGGDASNKYVVYSRGFKMDESRVRRTDNGYGGFWGIRGISILWIQDLADVDKKIYPYQRWFTKWSAVSQEFAAPKDMAFNTVFFLISDRQYDEAPVPLRIVRVLDDAVLATGVMDQKITSGLEWWVPFTLDRTVFCSTGERYRIEAGYFTGYFVEEASPTSMGFQGQSQYLLFKLALMSLPIKNFDLMDVSSTGADAVSSTVWNAIRFKPTVTGTLQSVEIKTSEKLGATEFIASLRADDGTGGAPAPTDIETKKVPATETPSSGWLTVPGFTTPLSADAYYWIVLKAGIGGAYALCRFTSPYRFMVKRSEDGGLTWTRCKEGPTELAFRVMTSTEIIEQGLEDVTTVHVSTTTWAAQSFSPSSNIKVKGILILLGKESIHDANDLRVTLQMDSGFDTPSRTILATGTLTYTHFMSKALYYVEFDNSYDLTANTKYWIVIKAVTGSVFVAPVFYKDPAKSFGGTTYKAKISNDSGTTWNLIDNREGDLIFGIVQHTTSVDYNTSDLSNDIENYHAYRCDEEPLHGWDSFLNVIQAQLFEDLLKWFESCTGLTWIYFGSTPPTVLRTLKSPHHFISSNGAGGPTGLSPREGHPEFFVADCQERMAEHFAMGMSNIFMSSSFGSKGSNRGSLTAEDMLVEYLLTYPMLAGAVVSFNDWEYREDYYGINNMIQQKYSRAFGEILSRMRYYGGHFGQEKGAVNVLAIRESDIGFLPQFLTPALNITMTSGEHEDRNLTRFGNFTQFDVITRWSSGKPPVLTENCWERIKNFVKNGGGYVAILGWNDLLNPVMGFDYSSAEVESDSIVKDYINYNHPILKPFTDINEYRCSYGIRIHKIAPYVDEFGTVGEVIVDAANGQPWITSHDYGLGRGVFIGLPLGGTRDIGNPPDFSGLQCGSPRDSFVVLLTNAFFYAAKKEHMLPVWWYGTKYRSEHAWNSYTHYSICGKPGSPILLWLTNNGTATNFEIHLNATFYGIDPSGWTAIDVCNWTMVANGTGTDIKINVTIPYRSWKPIYICNQAIDMHEVYSNIFILKRAVSPIQAVYTLQGPYKQTSWLIINSSRPIAEVILNETNLLTRRTSITSLNASDTPDGWFRDSANNLLYIKFKPTGTIHVVRINLPTLPFYERYPQLIPITAVAVITIIEVVVWAKRRRKAIQDK